MNFLVQMGLFDHHGSFVGFHTSLTGGSRSGRLRLYGILPVFVTIVLDHSSFAERRLLMMNMAWINHQFELPRMRPWRRMA
jgi:hypothetical protein